MNKFIDILTYIVFGIGFVLLIGLVLGGCDNLRCYPDFDINGQYIGIKCGGEW